ncbi:MAG: subclass B1 metallo-beta-lactamase [Bacteroidia bacterium]|nr:subclass B1 metallo-beta-lactamase [Bacteroidia bacterium]
MKKLLILLLIVFIQYTGFSQTDNKTIKVCKDINLIKLSESAYLHISYLDLPDYGRTPANGLIFINGNEAFVFNSSWTDSLTKVLFEWITDSMNLKVVGFIPNHWHNDCIGGLNYIHSQNIESFANQLTIDIAKSRNLPVPNHGFKDSIEISLGNKSIHCYYLGAAHSMDNIIVWIPSETILFAGCMIKSINSKDLGNVIDGDLVAYPLTIDRIISKFPNAKIVIPGHGQYGGVNLLTHTRKLLNK